MGEDPTPAIRTRTGAVVERCFVCGARDWRPTEARVRCSHCGLDVDPGRYDARAHGATLKAWLRPGAIDLHALGHGTEGPFTMDAFTLRIAASRAPLWVEPDGSEQAAALAVPHGPPARAHLVVPPPAHSAALGPPVALAGIARAEDAAALAERLVALGGGAPVAVVADAPSDAAMPAVRGATLLARPLGGPDGPDFGAQRDAAQAAAGRLGARWVLQLDDDETLDPPALAALHALARQAERQGTVSIGLRRRNLVDAIPSDLWPDVQYRLNHTRVRYGGRVHERPDAGHWRRTTIALCATIDHHLDRERIEQRERLYEGIERGGGRRGDGAALLRPYAP